MRQSTCEISVSAYACFSPVPKSSPDQFPISQPASFEKDPSLAGTFSISLGMILALEWGHIPEIL